VYGESMMKLLQAAKVTKIANATSSQSPEDPRFVGSFERSLLASALDTSGSTELAVVVSSTGETNVEVSTGELAVVVSSTGETNVEVSTGELAVVVSSTGETNVEVSSAHQNSSS
jgi:hypothetical protein